MNKLCFLRSQCHDDDDDDADVQTLPTDFLTSPKAKFEPYRTRSLDLCTVTKHKSTERNRKGSLRSEHRYTESVMTRVQLSLGRCGWGEDWLLTTLWRYALRQRMTPWE